MQWQTKIKKQKIKVKNKKSARYISPTAFFLTLIFIFHLTAFHPRLFAEESNKIKIGVVGPETGDDAETGLMTLAGIEQAAKDFNNAGGIDGKKIEIIHYDTKSDPQQTQVAVQKLVEEKVAAIIAAPTGWSTFGPVWIANAAKVVFMSAGSKRHIGRSGPFIFRNTLPDGIAADETIKYAVEKLKYKNYTLVTSMRDDETSLQIGGVFRGAIIKRGGKVLGETHIFMGATIEESVSQLKKDAKEAIDAVIFAGDADAAVDVLEELRKQGIKAPIIGGDILHKDSFLKRGGGLAAGTILYTGFFPGDKSPAVRKFVSEYKKKTNKEPTAYSAIAYESLMLIAHAIKEAGSTDSTLVRDALAKVKDFQGITGKLSMDANGEVIKQPYILKVTGKGKSARFELAE